MKVNCPLLAAKTTQVLVPATLRITDGHQGKTDPSRGEGRAFQLGVEEARATPYIVTGTFLINSLPALILFN